MQGSFAAPRAHKRGMPSRDFSAKAPGAPVTRARADLDLDHAPANPYGRSGAAGWTVRTREGSAAVNRVNVAVAVADEARGCIYEVAAACRALGMDHTATLTIVGVLTGSVELNNLGKLCAVSGVVAVEIESAFQTLITEMLH